MKREDLKKIEGMTDEMIQAVMNLHQIDANSWQSQKQTYIQKETELNEKLAKFDGVDVEALKKDLSDWQEKYKNDLLQKDIDYAKADLFKNYKFSSSYAKKAIERDFDEKGLKFENGSFIGADDFFKNALASDPGAFVQDQQDGTEGSEGSSSGSTTPPAGTGSASSSGIDLGRNGTPKTLTGVEKRFYELNPDLKK